MTVKKNFSYTDFLGVFGIENTPPLGLRSIDFWIDNADINEESIVLDLACSTGYTSRNIALKTDATCFGVDISKSSIIAAQKNRDIVNKFRNCSLTYGVGDAESLAFEDGKFTHIAGGSVFGFFGDKNKALEECHRVLEEDGYLCISSFYFKSPAPAALIDQVEKAIGYAPDVNRDFHFWKSFFEQYFIITEEQKAEIPINTDEEINDIVNFKLKSSASKLDNEEYEFAFNRLKSIRVVLNELHKYQGIVKWILKKKS